MKTANLTDKQRAILTTLDAVREHNAKGITERNPEAVPTTFVSWFQLNRSFGITLTQLDALVKKGFLVRNDDGCGSGPEFAKA